MSQTNPGACSELAEICSDRVEESKDALDAFAAVHLCICEGVEARNDLELATLNLEFTRVFVDAYRRYRQKRFGRAIPARWIFAYKKLKKHPVNHVPVMFALAKAHILVDLRRVLTCVDVKFQAYDSVADQIGTCLKVVGLGDAGQNTVENVWMAIARASLPSAVLTIRQARRLVYLLAQHDRKRLFHGLAADVKAERQRQFLLDEQYYLKCFNSSTGTDGV